MAQALSIEEIIKDHDRKYRKIKSDAERENYIRNAHWHSRSYKATQERIADIDKELDSQIKHRPVFPEWDYYRKIVAPAILEISSYSDSAEFDYHSRTFLEALAGIADVHVPGAATKKHAISAILAEYCEYLHFEPKEVAVGFAKFQTTRVNLHNGDGDYLWHDYEIKKWLADFKSSSFARFMPEILNIAGDINNGFIADAYLKNILHILRKFDEKGASEMIPLYLDISRRLQSPKEYVFDFKSPSIVDKMLNMKETLGEYFAKGIELYTNLAKRIDIHFFRSYEDELIKALKNLPEEIRVKSLNDAIELSKLDINGLRYLEALKDVLPTYNAANFLAYTADLGKISPECANSSFWHVDDIWRLPDTQRQEFLQKGLSLAKDFGGKIAKYFDEGRTVMLKSPARFDEWFSRIVYMANSAPKIVNEFIGISEPLLRTRMLDQAMYITLKLDDDLRQKTNGTTGEDDDAPIFSFDDPFRTLFNFFIASAYESDRMLSRADVDPYQYGEDLARFTKRKLLMAFQTIGTAIDKGADYTKYVEIAPEVYHLELTDHQLKVDMTPVINSDLDKSRKLLMLKEYSSVALVLKEMPVLDIDGKWKEKCRQSLVELVEKKFKIPVNQLEIADLIRLSSIDARNGYEEKIAYTIANLMQPGKVDKKFQLGKVYASEVLHGFAERADPVMMTRQLIYALISRDRTKRENAEKYFDASILEELRKLIPNPTMLYKQISKEIPGLENGSTEAAHNILDCLSIQFPKNDAMKDTVAGIEGLFTSQVSYDSIDARMQQGCFQDLFDNRTIMMCGLYPTGAHKEASFNYLFDDNVGFMHIVPKVAGEYQDAIGVAILVNVKDPKTKQRYLLVDSVEGGMSLDSIKDSVWMPLMHSAIMSAAKDNDCKYVIYNDAKENVKPKQFYAYAKKIGGDNAIKTIYLEKEPSGKILDAFAKPALDAIAAEIDTFNGLPESQKYDASYSHDEKIRSLKQNLYFNYGLYLESMHGYGYDLKNLRPVAADDVTGVVFSV